MAETTEATTPATTSTGETTATPPVVSEEEEVEDGVLVFTREGPEWTQPIRQFVAKLHMPDAEKPTLEIERVDEGQLPDWQKELETSWRRKTLKELVKARNMYIINMKKAAENAAKAYMSWKRRPATYEAGQVQEHLEKMEKTATRVLACQGWIMQHLYNLKEAEGLARAKKYLHIKPEFSRMLGAWNRFTELMAADQDGQNIPEYFGRAESLPRETPGSGTAGSDHQVGDDPNRTMVATRDDSRTRTGRDDSRTRRLDPVQARVIAQIGEVANQPGVLTSTGLVDPRVLQQALVSRFSGVGGVSTDNVFTAPWDPTTGGPLVRRPQPSQGEDTEPPLAQVNPGPTLQSQLHRGPPLFPPGAGSATGFGAGLTTGVGTAMPAGMPNPPSTTGYTMFPPGMLRTNYTGVPPTTGFPSYTSGFHGMGNVGPPPTATASGMGTFSQPQPGPSRETGAAGAGFPGASGVHGPGVMPSGAAGSTTAGNPYMAGVPGLMPQAINNFAAANLAMTLFNITKFIPKPYDGREENWASFNTGLTSATLQMDACQMSGVTKYAELKKVLTGTAANYVGALNPDDNNSFNVAVNILRTYFGRGVSEAMRLFQSLLEFPECKETIDGRMNFHGAIVKHLTKLYHIRNITPDIALVGIHLAVWEKRMGENLLTYWLKYKGRKADDDHPLGAQVHYEDVINCVAKYMQEKKDLKSAGGNSLSQGHYSRPTERKGPYFVQAAKKQTTFPSFPRRQGNVSAVVGKATPIPQKSSKAKETVASVMVRNTTQASSSRPQQGTGIQVPCPFCEVPGGQVKRQEHQHTFPLGCPKLKGPNPMSDQKIATKILKDRLCFLCCGRGHSAANCSSANKLRCPICKETTHCKYIHHHLKGEEPPPPYGRQQ